MIPSENLYKILKHYESCHLEAYLDSKGVATIGWGSTFYLDGKPVKMGDKITQEYADSLMPAIVLKFAQSVENMLKVPLNQAQFDALVDFAYNCGIGNLQKSTLLQYVNQKATNDKIVAEFLKWNKSGGKVLRGLTFRRQSEAHLFQSGEVVFYN